MSNNGSPIVKWLFALVGIVLAGINAVLSWQFGSWYFAPAFGVGVLAMYLAGFYALLLFDVGYISWFSVFLRGAAGKGQRALALLMAVISLGGSIIATVNQLAANSFGLVDLAQYQDSVGFAALSTMIIITAAHIIAFASFILLDPKERVKTEGANILSEVIEDALSEMRARLNADKDVLIDHISADYRADMLTALGFTTDLQRMGKQPAMLPAPASQPKTTGAGDGRQQKASPSPTPEIIGEMDIDLLISLLSEEKKRQDRGARIDNDPTNDPHPYSHPYPNVTIFDAPENGANFTTGNGRSM